MTRQQIMEKRQQIIQLHEQINRDVAKILQLSREIVEASTSKEIRGKRRPGGLLMALALGILAFLVYWLR